MCADVAQPDQARIVGINAQYFLKNSGNFVISIKASCIDSTAPPEAVFAREVRFSSHNAARLPLLSPTPLHQYQAYWIPAIKNCAAHEHMLLAVRCV